MSATATCTLVRAWLMDPTDPTHPIVAGTTGAGTGGAGGLVARNNDTAKDGEFRNYANRVRVVTRSVTNRQYGLSLRALTLTQVKMVEGWAGRILLFRDVYGRRRWGSFLATSRFDYVGKSGLCDISFTFTEVTYSDAV